MERGLKFEFEGGAESYKPLSKAVEIEVNTPGKEFLYIERMKDGKYRMTWSSTFFPEDISKLQCMRMERK